MREIAEKWQIVKQAVGEQIPERKTIVEHILPAAEIRKSEGGVGVPLEGVGGIEPEQVALLVVLFVYNDLFIRFLRGSASLTVCSMDEK